MVSPQHGMVAVLGLWRADGKQERWTNTLGVRKRPSPIPRLCPTTEPSQLGLSSRGLKVPRRSHNRGKDGSFKAGPPALGLPFPTHAPHTWGLGTRMSKSPNCHCDSALKLTRAQQGMRVGQRPPMSRAVPSSPNIATAVRSARFLAENARRVTRSDRGLDGKQGWVVHRRPHSFHCK
jgi:hypothetical protein